MNKQIYNQPIFILGNPRSGTSLLRLMLSCHPDIIIPPESHFFLWLENKYKNMNPMADDLEEFFIDLYKSRKFETWDISKQSIIETIKKDNIKSFADLIACIYITYGNAVGKNNFKYWGDKNKLWKENLHKTILYFPNAFFIHLVRDGRDVACSFIDLAIKGSTSIYAPKLPSQISDIANRWKTNVNFINEFLIDIPKSNQLTIRYEDLVLNTQATLHEIMQLLSIEYSQNMLDYQNSKFDMIKEPKEFIDWKHKLNSPLDQNNIGKYKNILSDQDTFLFEQIAKRELYNYSYL